MTSCLGLIIPKLDYGLKYHLDAWMKNIVIEKSSAKDLGIYLPSFIKIKKRA